MNHCQDWTEITIGNGNKKKQLLKQQSLAPPKPKNDEDEDPPKFQPFNKQLLSNLMDARKTKGLSRVDLAKQFMFKVSDIENLENGKCDFNSKHAKSLYVAIMRKLGVNINMASLNNS